jgi:succinyl-CoA synthetase beta subunit
MFARLVSQRSAGLTLRARRFFDLHEYQSKDLMAKYGVTVQKGAIATSAEEAEKVAAKLDAQGGLILKSQVHAGGRGKGTLTSGLKGGVQVLKTPKEVGEFTKKMLGYNLITHQTTKAGLKVNAVLIHEGVDIKRQIYLAFILDRNSQGPALVASVNGGMEIEEVAKKDPKSILVEPIDVAKGLTPEILNRVVKNLQL